MRPGEHTGYRIMSKRYNHILKTIWNNTPGFIQLLIIVFGGVFIVWFLLFVSVFVDTESTAAKAAAANSSRKE